MYNLHEKLGGRNFSLIVIMFLRFLCFNNKFSQKLLNIPIVTRMAWKFYKFSMSTLIYILSMIKPSKYIRSDPFELLWVSPNDIEYVFDACITDLEAGIRYGRVLDGSWDCNERL